ncbi:MAG: protein transporter tim9 [Paramarteilia canceri]
MKEFGRAYTQLTDNCFQRCVHSMYDSQLSNSEKNCISSCADKIVKASQRMMIRFHEQNILMGSPQNNSLS